MENVIIKDYNGTIFIKNNYHIQLFQFYVPLSIKSPDIKYHKILHKQIFFTPTTIFINNKYICFVSSFCDFRKQYNCDINYYTLSENQNFKINPVDHKLYSCDEPIKGYAEFNNTILVLQENMVSVKNINSYKVFDIPCSYFDNIRVIKDKFYLTSNGYFYEYDIKNGKYTPSHIENELYIYNQKVMMNYKTVPELYSLPVLYFADNEKYIVIVNNRYEFFVYKKL